MSEKVLAARCRALPSELAVWERMENADCTGTQLVILCLALRVSILWLALGIGAMEANATSAMRKVQLGPIKLPS